MSSLTNLFSIRSMISPGAALGELPSTKEAYKDALTIALPSVAEMVLISLIGSFDTMMVGGLGPQAISAVGLCGQPRMMLMSIFFALNIGVTAIVARRKGEGRQGEANRTLRNALLLSAAVSVLMMSVAFLVSRPLVMLAGAQPDTIDMALTYFNILIWFLPVNGISMCICAAQRGTGNTRITMIVNLASNIINLFFNYLLINGNWGFPKLGVAGAAIATGIGFCVGLVLCVVTIYDSRRNFGFLRISRHDKWNLEKETVSAIAKVSKSAMAEQVALRIGFFSYAAIVANLGTSVNAAHQIVAQFMSISFGFGDGLGVAGTALVGQMLGRKRPDLAVIFGKVCQRLALAVAVLLASTIIVFRYPMVRWFTTDTDVINLAAGVMLMLAAFQPLQTSSVVISGCLRGAGDTKYVATIMMVCVMLIRPLLSLLAIFIIKEKLDMPEIALMGAWSASIVDMSIRLTGVYRRFNGGKWHDIKL